MSPNAIVSRGPLKCRTPPEVLFFKLRDMGQRSTSDGYQICLSS